MQALLRSVPLFLSASALIIAAGCAHRRPPPAQTPSIPPPPVAESFPATKGSARWVPVLWEDLPGFSQDNLSLAWNAWLVSCDKPTAAFASLCPLIRAHAIASAEEQQAFLRAHLQAYRVENESGQTQGLLTSYYEPVFTAQRQNSNGFIYPLYQTPTGWQLRQGWYTRQQADTLPEAQAALRGREIAYLNNPIDPLVLQIQGSGQLRVREADGSERMVRLSYAGTNEKPYQSVARWLAANTSLRNYSWSAIKEWAQANPGQVQPMLWSNPRVVFFKETALAASAEPTSGPTGAQGLPLTAGRSIAIDPSNIPYGTPVWLHTTGYYPMQRLVLAQDTGSAIKGAVRADFYAGSGPEAGDFANRIKQPLWMWALWPKNQPAPH